MLFELGKSGMKRLIVGVDPGVTVGLAALSFDGVPISVDSRRNWALSDLIKTVSELGSPTIISSDVTPASTLLEKLSVKFNAVLFAPLLSMTADEKHQTARAYAELHGLKLRNAHEVDALASAVKAYQHYEKKFGQVNARVKKQKLNVSADDVKDLLVRGHTLKRAIQILQGSEKVQPAPVVRRRVPREERLKSLIGELEGRLSRERLESKRLRAANKELRLKTKTLKTEISDLQDRIEETRSEQSARVRREREYQMLLDEVQKAKARLSEYSAQLEVYKTRFNQLQRLRELESQGKLVLLKPVEAFTENGLRKAFRLYGVKAGEYVLLLDPSGGGSSTAETLAKRGPKAIVTKGSMSHYALGVFAKYLIPVVPSGRLEIEWIEGMPYAESESLRKAVKQIGEMEASKAYEDLRTILEEHRKEVEE